MLEAGCDSLLLDAGGHLDSELCHHEGFLAVAFQGTAPALVAGYVEDGCVDAMVAQEGGLPACNAPGLPHEGAVPGGTYGYWRGERRGLRVVQPVYALVGELHGDSETGVLDEPSLHGVEGLHMIREGIDIVLEAAGALADSVQMFVYVGQTVLPDFPLPTVARKRILQDTPGTVQGYKLAGLFLESHAPEKVLDPVLDRSLRILVNIFLPVLVEIYPAPVINVRRQNSSRKGQSGYYTQCHSDFLLQR